MTVDGTVVGAIGRGLVLLVGVGRSDSTADADYLVDKLAGLRIFEDAGHKMNLSVMEVEGSLLVVSQFTLLADTRKGRRPSFDAAAPPDKARDLYEYFVARAKTTGLRVETGVFQATMSVALCNEGPVTLVVESPGTD